MESDRVRRAAPAMQVLMLAGQALVGGILVWFILSRRFPPPEVLQDLGLLLAVIGVYAWLVCPLALCVLSNSFSAVVLLWAWQATAQPLIVADLLIMCMLAGIAAFQARNYEMRLRELDRVIEDLTEQRTLKEQAVTHAVRAQEALTRKHGRYLQLQSIAEQLSAMTDIDTNAGLAVESAYDLIGKSDVCLLFLLNAEDQELSLVASQKNPRITSIRAKHGDAFDKYVLRTHRPLLVNDVRRDFRFSLNLDTDRSIGSVIACPLLIGPAAEGVLRLDSPQAASYTQDDLRFLDILLDLISTAVTNARLFSRTQQLAQTDGLTGLALRRTFMEQLTRELSRAERSGDRVSICMADVDHFKRYNDTYGHTAGDLILKTVADVLRKAAPNDAMVARYGGEEFAVLLPHVDESDARTVAENMRRAVEARFGADKPGLNAPVTLSIGTATFPKDAAADLELIRVADERLYCAKRSGRNTVCSSS